MDSNGNWIINPKPLYAYLAVDAILAISCFSGLLPYSTGWLIGAVAFHICLLWYLLISIKEKRHVASAIIIGAVALEILIAALA